MLGLPKDKQVCFSRNKSLRRLIKVAAISFAAIFLVGAAGVAYNYYREETAPPQNIRVTNLSEGGATVSWTTERPTWGVVYFSEDPAKLSPGIIAGYRAKTAEDNLFATVHYVTLPGLSPEKTYYYLLGSGLHTYKSDKITTLPVSDQPPPLPQALYGHIKQRDGLSPAFPAVVILRRDGVLPISALTNEEGNWILNAANLRTPQGEPPAFPQESDVYILEVEAGALGSITTAISLDLAQPAPEVVLQ